METSNEGTNETSAVETESVQTEAPVKEVSFREALTENMAKDEAERPKQPNQYTKKEEVAPEGSKAPAAAPILPPADMSPEEREHFAKQTPEMQAYLARRSYETRVTLSREMQKTQEAGRKYEALESVIAPNREYLALKGIDETALVRRAIAWDQKLDRDRIGGAREWLAAQGIDPFELIEDGQPQNQHSQANVQSMLTPEQVEDMIAQRLERENQTREQAHTTLQHMTVVERFKEGKPLFREPSTALELEAEMAPIIESIVLRNPNIQPDKALEQAYNYVTKGNERFSTLLDSFSQREAAERARVDGERARQSSRSLSSGGLAGSNRSSEGLSFREELRLRKNGMM